ncbi:MAG: hypothetical protein OHK003_25970 [Anaerolineales bacterium]
MSKYTLTLLDTTAIQEYIFASNRLQENIGASEIVYRATTLWAFEALESVDKDGKKLFTHNILMKDNRFEWDYLPDFQIEKHPALNAVEVIYAAGGNAVLMFKNTETAKEFTKILTLHVLQNAPGLTVLAQYLEFDWEADMLADEIDSAGKTIKEGKRTEINNLMAIHKRSIKLPAASIGFGVTAVCDSTGLPAIATNEPYKSRSDEPTLLISNETNAKLANRSFANDRLELLIGDTKGTKFPYDIDLLGRTSGEESYVAVVHADGNGIGRHVQNAMSNKKNNREYVSASRAFSKAIHQISLNTIKLIVTSLLNAIEIEPNGDKYIKTVPLAKKNNVHYLPFRPLVFGGDDVTFLCNGQFGVELATNYLLIFGDEARKAGIVNLYASAGVSIVKMHYPFARAYKLAEELTASAKKLVKDTKPETDFSAIDWHFAQSGLSGSLKVIREREYTVKSGCLAMRPLKMKGDPRSWETVKSVMRSFDKEWSEKRNKVIGLREPLRNGGDAVRKYLLDYELSSLPEIPGLAIQDTGWHDKRCYYFDAIELLDHYVSLESEKAEAKQ